MFRNIFGSTSEGNSSRSVSESGDSLEVNIDLDIAHSYVNWLVSV